MFVAVVLLFKVCAKVFYSFFSSPDLMLYFPTHPLTFVSLSLCHFQLFWYSPRKSSNILLALRFLQGVVSLTVIALIALAIAFTELSIPDMFACVLGFIPTGWALLSLAITWKWLIKLFGLWETVREFGRIYDAAMGMLIFAPIALLSWFPFISTFQSRLLFNQAFSRGLEISIILAGNRANVETWEISVEAEGTYFVENVNELL